MRTTRNPRDIRPGSGTRSREERYRETPYVPKALRSPRPITATDPKPGIRDARLGPVQTPTTQWSATVGLCDGSRHRTCRSAGVAGSVRWRIGLRTPGSSLSGGRHRRACPAQGRARDRRNESLLGKSKQLSGRPASGCRAGRATTPTDSALPCGSRLPVAVSDRTSDGVGITGGALRSGPSRSARPYGTAP